MDLIEALECHSSCDGLYAVMRPERPITVDEACFLRTILFGDLQSSFGTAWTEQSFHFKRNKPFSYGIVQKRGGPCGVLAAVQAFVLQEMLFGHKKCELNEGLLRPTLGQKKLTLSVALSKILWNAAGSKKNAFVAVKREKVMLNTEVISEDGVLEYVHLKHFNCKACLLQYFFENANELMDDRSGSCVLFLYSLLLSHGIEEIEKEAQGSERFIGEDGFSSQEIINLILVGKAVPNLFDGNQEHDLGGSQPSLLRGIPHKSDIGLLSSLEPFCEVGNYYKNPRYPIFVLNCHHHYTVLFGTSKRILTDLRNEFTLYHYDGLDKTETSFIINPCGGNHKDLKAPPVWKCIYSRWPSASITCNKSEDSDCR